MYIFDSIRFDSIGLHTHHQHTGYGLSSDLWHDSFIRGMTHSYTHHQHTGCGTPSWNHLPCFNFWKQMFPRPARSGLIITQCSGARFLKLLMLIKTVMDRQTKQADRQTGQLIDTLTEDRQEQRERECEREKSCFRLVLQCLWEHCCRVYCPPYEGCVCHGARCVCVCVCMYV